VGRTPAPNISTQLAELIALTKALQLSQGKRVNIYTDFKYAFLILHVHAAIWGVQGMLTVSGSPTKHSQMILKLLDLSSFPKKWQLSTAQDTKRLMFP
jgi:ribonuclease HI